MNIQEVVVGQKYIRKDKVGEVIRSGDKLRVVEVNADSAEMERCEAGEGLTHESFGLKVSELREMYVLSE